jgi:hypothetical protein
VVIIAQPFRDVGIEYFVDDELLADQGSWPKVPFAAKVGAPILKRALFHNLDRTGFSQLSSTSVHNSVRKPGKTPFSSQFSSQLS